METARFHRRAQSATRVVSIGNRHAQDAFTAHRVKGELAVQTQSRFSNSTSLFEK